ncbi:unnamed protein product [Knipowitschia caucasica]
MCCQSVSRHSAEKEPESITEQGKVSEWLLICQPTVSAWAVPLATWLTNLTRQPP